MFGFLLKKFFYDLWDNFFLIIALNFGFLLFVSLAYFLFRLSYITKIIYLPVIILLVFVYLLLVFLCCAVSVLKNISDYRRPNPADFFKNIKRALVPAAVLFTGLVFLFFIIRITVPVYLEMAGITGWGAAFFSCWICFFIVVCVQFYPPAYYRFGRRPFKSLKKCAAFVFDNALFGFFALIVTIVLSVPVLPFPCCPLLFLDEALRLRLLKYDWLLKQKTEQQSENRSAVMERKKIPWKELLKEETENTGNRTWKSFVFPWK